jgi:Uma2 family endonuclease
MSAQLASTEAADLVTVDEFFALVEDGQKADLIDGVIYMASPDSARANRIANFVQFLLSGHADVTGTGEVFASRFAFILSQYRAPEPDVAWVSAARAGIIEERGGIGAPDVAVEVVSRDSRSRDYVEKRRVYEEAGVREYWLIDPLRKQTEFLRLRGSRFVTVEIGPDRIFRSSVVPGFWMEIDWLFTYPLPRASQCLERILATLPSSKE